MNLSNINFNVFIKKYSLALISVAIISILGIMLYPLPEILIDILITFNIAISLIILFTAIKAKEPLEFSILPSLLLITTLLRLSLNIASTKSILTKGSAGKLIEAFGNFVVGGNAIVGAIVFLIIIIVQFTVITKGSERISEVTARFSLDAMPLKFMSVDAALNQGSITELEAETKRNKIQSEADFYGAMDGATKFVKGDSIAGLIIAAINILAGFGIGMMIHKLGFAESLNKYTLLTVGDGLLSSIPSLIISVATGIIVTRPFSEENMGDEVITQLGTGPQVFYISAVVSLLLMTIPGTNKMVFICLSLVLGALGYVIQKTQKEPEVTESANEQTKEEMNEQPNYAEEFNSMPLEIEVGYGLVHIVNKNSGGQLLDKLERIRERTLSKLGFLIPSIRTRDNVNLNPYQYKILINGLEVASYELEIGKLLAISTTQEPIELEGITTYEPSYNFEAKWIDKELVKVAESKGYTIVDNVDVITSHFENIVTKHAHEILTREMVKELVGYVKEKNETIVEELIPNKLTLADVQKVICNLLREGVSIKNLNLILEALSDNAEYNKEPEMLTDFARLKLRKQIIASLDQGEEIHYISIAYESEDILKDRIVESTMHTKFLALDPDTSAKFMSQLEELLEFSFVSGKLPILMCSPKIRFYLAKYLESKAPFIKVLSTEELAIPNLNLKHVGQINI